MSDTISPAPVTTTVRGRPFQSGEAWTGNRQGRPPLAEWQRGLAEVIRNHAKVGPNGEHLIEQVVAIARDPHTNYRARLEAIKILLERGWGKALESLNISGGLMTLDPAKLARLSDVELEQAAAIVAKLTTEG